MTEKVKIARLSIFSNSLLILLKFIAGFISGSVSILSEAIHSAMDLVASIIAFLSVRVSDNPPDERHPYGHGKYENISGVLEALLILVAAAWIVYEAISRMLSNTAVESLGLGSVVMFISAGVNIVVSRKLYKVARKTNSVALEADALHLKTDVYTSLGVGIGLLVILLTGIHWLDSVIAILVALIIVKESYDLLKRAYFPLVDISWDKRELDHLENLLREMQIQYHGLKTRKAGSQMFVEFHIELEAGISLDQAHASCDAIEERLRKEIPRLQVSIHAEPLGTG